MWGTCALAAALACAVSVPAVAQDAGTPGVAVVYMADGSSLPLRSWSLSYEYLAWKQGQPPALSAPARRESTDLWLGRRAFPAVGLTILIGYGEVEREQEVDGVAQKVRVPLAREVSLTAPGGKKSRHEPEPPSRQLLVPNAEKSLFVQARSLDLRGETVTGTRRELCLWTYTSLVECAGTPDHQVVKVEFHD